MPPPVYSHSRLSCFEDCPKRFHYRYVQRLPAESESVEAFLGKRVHAVLERLHAFVDRGLVPSLDRVLHRFRAMWDEAWDPERVRVVREGEGPDDYRRTGERCLERFYRRHYPFDADETLALEERVTVDLDPARGHRLQGFVDRLVRARDGAVEIHDYKTSRRVPSQKRLDEDRQLALYQLAVRRTHPHAPIRLVWHYLVHGVTRVSTRSDEQLEALRRDTSELIERIEREERFEARPGPLCAWCEYRDLCPDAAGRREPAPRADARPEPRPLPAPRPDVQLDLL